MQAFNPKQYLVTPVEPMEKVLVLKRKPISSGRMFTYGIKFKSNYPSCTCAIATVVAQDVMEALRLLRSALFMEYYFLWELNQDLSVGDVSVVGQASTNSLGLVTILTDGEY